MALLSFVVTDNYSMASVKVMDFKELCQILEIPEEEPQMEPPSPTGQPADIHTFLAARPSTVKRWPRRQYVPGSKLGAGCY